MKDIPETSFTWDHDDGKIHISTNRRKIISRLASLGFYPRKNDKFGAEFIASDTELGITFRRRKSRPFRPATGQK
jgi:hypothetical protein